MRFVEDVEWWKDIGAFVASSCVYALAWVVFMIACGALVKLAIRLAVFGWHLIP